MKTIALPLLLLGAMGFILWRWQSVPGEIEEERVFYNFQGGASSENRFFLFLSTTDDTSSALFFWNDECWPHVGFSSDIHEESIDIEDLPRQEIRINYSNQSYSGIVLKNNDVSFFAGLPNFPDPQNSIIFYGGQIVPVNIGNVFFVTCEGNLQVLPHTVQRMNSEEFKRFIDEVAVDRQLTDGVKQLDDGNAEKLPGDERTP